MMNPPGSLQDISRRIHISSSRISTTTLEGLEGDAATLTGGVLPTLYGLVSKGSLGRMNWPNVNAVGETGRRRDAVSLETGRVDP